MQRSQLRLAPPNGLSSQMGSMNMIDYRLTLAVKGLPYKHYMASDTFTKNAIVQFDRRMGGTRIKFFFTSYPHRHGAMYCVSQFYGHFLVMGTV